MKSPQNTPGKSTRTKMFGLVASLSFCAGGVQGLDLEWVTVSDPGNAPDKTGYGAVAYEFQITKTEVTLGQYAEFLNAVAATDPRGLWSPSLKDAPKASMVRERVLIDRVGTSGAYRYEVPEAESRKPVMFINFLDAMRFANWVNNGLGNSDTETGAYDIQKDKGLEVHGANATVWVPTEDEWYKAAYFQPETKGGPPGGYWTYPMRTNERPAFREAGALEQNSASFDGYAGDLEHKSYQFVPVGSFPNAGSYYGTFDQGGNVWEWNEGIVFDTQRGMRGGSTPHTFEKLKSGARSSASPDRKYPDTGFRLARAIPKAPPAPAVPASTPKQP